MKSLTMKRRGRRMAIQPIDLQAIFSQMDKVGKNQALLREGQQLNDSLQQVQTQRKLEENIQSVNQAQDTGEETGKIKDGKSGNANHGKQREGESAVEEEEETGKKDDMIRDPALGRNIDISG